MTGIIGAIIFSLNQNKFGNFLLHASGGVSSVFLYVYLIKTLKINFNWRLATLLAFAFVSTLGVMNELAEYFLELIGIGIYSHDTHDTWRDFVANTTGVALTWLIYLLTLIRK